MRVERLPTVPVTLRPEATDALEAVSAALGLVRARVGADDVTSKGDRDVVTATDVAVERAIRQRLEATGFAVVGEEQGGEAPPDGSGYWLVDPICGTRNFASGIALYAVNVALVERAEVTLGVVGDPSGEISVAQRGRGTWVFSGGPPRRLMTSAVSRTVIVELGRASQRRRERAAEFVGAAIRGDRWDLRDFGTTLSLAFVAAGRFAGYIVFSIPAALHSAAGALMVAEAGGIVTDIDGDEWTIGSDSIVASAGPSVHDELIELLRR